MHEARHVDGAGGVGLCMMAFSGYLTGYEASIERLARGWFYL